MNTEASSEKQNQLPSAYSVFDKTWKLFISQRVTIAKINFLIFLPVFIVFHYLVYAEVFNSPWIEAFYYILILFTFTSLSFPILVYAMDSSWNGSQSPPLHKLFAFGFRKWAKVLFYSLLQLIIVIAGLAVMVVPGVYLGVRYTFLSLVATLESGSCKEVFARSTFLSRGRWRLVFTSLLLVMIPIFVFGLVSGFILGIFDNRILAVFFDCLDATISSAMILAILVLYKSAPKEIG